MVIDKTTPYGNIKISTEVIASLAGNAAIECYGVVGLSSRNSLRENIMELLKSENYSKGVNVKKNKSSYDVDIHIVVAYGVKISEVVNEVQKRVKYVLEKTFEIKFKSVNVYVQALKEI